MIPVRPIPPHVAWNNSSDCTIFIIAPSGSIMSKSIKYLLKQPSIWWFLPWTSLAIAPPIVICFVPGVTAKNQPSGTILDNISSMVIPDWTFKTPLIESKEIIEL